MAGAILLAFFIVVPSHGWVGSLEFKEAFYPIHRRTLVFIVLALVRAAVLPVLWWDAWHVLGTFEGEVFAREAVRSAGFGLIVALTVPMWLALHAICFRDKLSLRLEPWAITTALLLAMIAAAPVTAGWNWIGVIGTLGIVAGAVAGYVHTGVPEGARRRLFIGSTFVACLLATTVGIVLAPLRHAEVHPVLWVLCILKVNAIGLLYGSWIRGRISDFEELSLALRYHQSESRDIVILIFSVILTIVISAAILILSISPAF